MINLIAYISITDNVVIDITFFANLNTLETFSISDEAILWVLN